MIYTTYLANEKNIPDGVQRILISRFVPKFFKLNERPEFIWMPALAPSHQLLAAIKEKSISWSEFKEEFIRESFISKDFQKAYKKIKNYDSDICLICYEKEPIYCHRSIIAEMLKLDDLDVKEL